MSAAAARACGLVAYRIRPRPRRPRHQSFVYECGDGLSPEEVARYDALSLQSLAQLGIGGGSMLAVDDFSQDIRVQLIVVHRCARSELPFAV